MNDMHKLLLKVDSLTYNAMQVLNALIRSSISSGSSSGYKVVKYGNEIVLSRSDIYKLNDFYEHWEAMDFPSGENEFYRLLGEADARWRKNPGDTETLATDAVVKHSQILFMSGRDSGNVGDLYNNYWLDKVRVSGTPKATVGTAPIPLNLRTPLYDENLSTKSFSQFETYLFPIGYRRAEIIGTPGNGDDYVAGGANWTIDASEILDLKGNHVTLGNVTNPPNRMDNYGSSVNTISWGLESYALRDNSLAFGVNSVALADNAIVFGENCVGSGHGSFIAGGFSGDTLGEYSFATNDRTLTVGKDSFAANHGTVAGTWDYSFSLPVVSESTEIDCPVVVTSDGKCHVNSSELVNYSVIRIEKTEIDFSELGYLDIEVGDVVAVYNTRYLFGNIYEGPGGRNGYARDAFLTTVLAIKEVVENDTIVAYDITLKESIPVVDAKYGPLTGGYVTAVQRIINEYNDAGGINGKRELLIGSRSAAFGESTLARGNTQVVFGEMNVPNDYAKMIVGAGRYISADGQTRYRANALLVGDSYSYFKLTNDNIPNGFNAIMGISSGIYTVPDAEQTLLEQGAFLRASDERYGTTLVNASGNVARMRVNDTTGNTIGRVAIAGAPGFLGDTGYETVVVSSYQGSTVISSGSYVAGDYNKGVLVDTLLLASPVIKSRDEHAVAIYAQDGIDICNTQNANSRGINIETPYQMKLSCGNLKISGDTFGTLPASCISQSFLISGNADGDGTSGRQDDIYYAHTVGRSGFYVGKVNEDNFVVYGTTTSDWNNLFAHVISSAYYDKNNGVYQVAAITIPSDIEQGDLSVVRPMVTASTIEAPGNNNSWAPYQPSTSHDKRAIYSKPLAFYDDVTGWCMAPMAAYGYEMSGSAIQSSKFVSAKNGSAGFPLGVYHESNWDIGYGFVKVNAQDDNYGAYQRQSINETHTHKFSIMTTALEEMLHCMASFLLVGNHLDLHVKIKPGPYVAYLGYNSSQTSRLRIPLLLGCRVRSDISNYPGNIWWTLMDNDSSYGALSWNGTETYTKLATSRGDSARLSPYYLANAIAFTNGIVIVEIDISAVVSEDAWTDDIDFVLSGPAKFVSDERCRRGDINTAWQNAMRSAYDGKEVMKFESLQSALVTPRF